MRTKDEGQEWHSIPQAASPEEPRLARYPSFGVPQLEVRDAGRPPWAMRLYPERRQRRIRQLLRRRDYIPKRVPQRILGLGRQRDQIPIRPQLRSLMPAHRRFSSPARPIRSKARGHVRARPNPERGVGRGSRRHRARRPGSNGRPSGSARPNPERRSVSAPAIAQMFALHLWRAQAAGGARVRCGRSEKLSPARSIRIERPRGPWPCRRESWQFRSGLA